MDAGRVDRTRGTKGKETYLVNLVIPVILSND